MSGTLELCCTTCCLCDFKDPPVCGDRICRECVVSCVAKQYSLALLKQGSDEAAVRSTEVRQVLGRYTGGSITVWKGTMETNRPLGSDSVASTDQIAALSKRCLDQKSKVDVAVQQLENLIASVEQKRAPFQAEVNKVGAELQNLLRNRIDLLNQQSSNICAKTVERLNQQKSVLTTISERLEGACSYSLAAMNSSSNESVMRARKQSSETLQIVEGALYNSEKLRPCENDGVFTILDKTACLKAISSLGVILPPGGYRRLAAMKHKNKPQNRGSDWETGAATLVPINSNVPHSLMGSSTNKGSHPDRIHCFCVQETTTRATGAPLRE
ncbi:hypothetical protein Pelo_643 [Pelomyxa schiedti]|nr:hypothetical protein Pelo_643 [Pelomyxa schiedti]